MRSCTQRLCLSDHDGISVNPRRGTDAMTSRVLTQDQAIEIYRRKPCAGFTDRNVAAGQLGDSRGRSVHLARIYGVSSKAIRDVWNRRTWAFATCRLWQAEQAGDLSIESFGPSTIRVRTQIQYHNYTIPISSLSIGCISGNYDLARFLVETILPAIYIQMKRTL